MRSLKRIIIPIILLTLASTLILVTPASAVSSHVWSEWVVDKEPTCDENGHRYRICTLDPGYRHTEEEDIPALGHNYKIVKDVIPTCTRVGTRTYKCTRCSKSYKKNYGVKVAHQYTSQITKKATCTQAGVKTYTCKVCGTKYTEKIAKISHQYVSKVTRQPNCKEVGELTYTCKMCSTSYKEKFGSLTDHKYVETVRQTDTQEIKTYTCSVCGDTYDVVTELPTEPPTTIPTTTVITTTKAKADPAVVADVALGGTNFMAVGLFAFLLVPDLIVLAWYKRKKKAAQEKQGDGNGS